jgi:hypothetical protein
MNREEFQRELRIATLIQALYAIKDSEELYEALLALSQGNLKIMHDTCTHLLLDEANEVM